MKRFVSADSTNTADMKTEKTQNQRYSSLLEE